MKKLLQNKLFQQIGIYTGANLIAKGVPFFMLFFLTEHLGKEGYGVYSNFLGLVALIVPFVGVNVMASVSRMYVKKDVDKGSFISTSVYFISILCIVFSILLALFAQPIAEFTEIPVLIIYGVAVYAWLNNINEVILAIWRMEDKPIAYGVFSILRTIFEISLSVFLILNYDLTYEGRVLGLFIAFSFFTLLAIFFLYKKGLLVWKFSKIDLRSILHFGLPLIPHVLSATVIMFSDKLFITNMIDIEANGVYSVAFQVGMGISLIQTSINQAWIPWFYKRMENPSLSFKLKVVKLTYIYFIGITLVALLLWILTPIIFSFMGREFGAGMELVLWIALGFAFNGMYKMVGAYLFYLEKTVIIGLVSIFAAMCNITLNYWLIPLKGLEGAALATMSTLFIQFIFVWYFSAKLYKMPWNLKERK